QMTSRSSSARSSSEDAALDCTLTYTAKAHPVWLADRLYGRQHLRRRPMTRRWPGALTLPANRCPRAGRRDVSTRGSLVASGGHWRLRAATGGYRQPGMIAIIWGLELPPPLAPHAYTQVFTLGIVPRCTQLSRKLVVPVLRSAACASVRVP